MLSQKRKSSTTPPTSDARPTKKQKTNSISTDLESVKKIGGRAALKGFKQPTIEGLLQRNYNQAQAAAYLEGFNEKKGNESQQAIRKAKNAAHIALSTGSQRATIEQLKQRCYSQEQIIAYNTVFDNRPQNEHQLGIKKAKRSGYDAARHSKACATIEQLKKRKYSQEQIMSYYKSYEQYRLKKYTSNTLIELESSAMPTHSDEQPPALALSTNTKECDVAFFASTLYKTEEDNFYTPSPFDILKNKEDNFYVPDSFDVLNKAEEVDFFVPKPFDILANPGEIHASPTVAPMLFNYSTKTGLEHNTSPILEKTEDIFEVLKWPEIDEFIANSKPF